MSNFDVTIAEQGGTVHVALAGELDISTGPRLDDDLRRIETDQPQTIVVDLQELQFMDSTGLRILITADMRARAAGRRLAIVQGNESVRRVLRVTRLDERLEVIESADLSSAG